MNNNPIVYFDFIVSIFPKNQIFFSVLDNQNEMHAYSFKLNEALCLEVLM